MTTVINSRFNFAFYKILASGKEIHIFSGRPLLVTLKSHAKVGSSSSKTFRILSSTSASVRQFGADLTHFFVFGQLEQTHLQIWADKVQNDVKLHAKVNNGLF